MLLFALDDFIFLSNISEVFVSELKKWADFVYKFRKITEAKKKSYI